MKSAKPESIIDAAAARLRELSRQAENEALLGSEEELIAQLGVSRATLRQVARLLEREGWLKVRRGINGGYIAARPDLRNIESTVSAYLEMVDTSVKEANSVISALWGEVVKRAASIEDAQRRDVAQALIKKVSAVSADAGFADVFAVEKEIRSTIFKLINSHYIELIFQINLIFMERHFPTRPSDLDNAVEHREFVNLWRNAKNFELSAIVDGDEELALMAARHSRKIWDRRIWGENFSKSAREENEGGSLRK